VNFKVHLTKRKQRIRSISTFARYSCKHLINLTRTPVSAVKPGHSELADVDKEVNVGVHLTKRKETCAGQSSLVHICELLMVSLDRRMTPADADKPGHHRIAGVDQTSQCRSLANQEKDTCAE
jgi:hypothetical protein